MKLRTGIPKARNPLLQSQACDFEIDSFGAAPDLPNVSLFPFNSYAIAKIRQAKYGDNGFHARSYIEEVIEETLANYSKEFAYNKFPSKKFLKPFGRLGTPPAQKRQYEKQFGHQAEQVEVLWQLWNANDLSVLEAFGIALKEGQPPLPDPVEPDPIEPDPVKTHSARTRRHSHPENCFFRCNSKRARWLAILGQWRKSYRDVSPSH